VSERAVRMNLNGTDLYCFGVLSNQSHDQNRQVKVNSTNEFKHKCCPYNYM